MRMVIIVSPTASESGMAIEWHVHVSIRQISLRRIVVCIERGLVMEL